MIKTKLIFTGFFGFLNFRIFLGCAKLLAIFYPLFFIHYTNPWIIFYFSIFTLVFHPLYLPWNIFTLYFLVLLLHSLSKTFIPYLLNNFLLYPCANCSILCLLVVICFCSILSFRHYRNYYKTLYILWEVLRQNRLLGKDYDSFARYITVLISMILKQLLHR